LLAARANCPHPLYDVSGNGRRFLMLNPCEQEASAPMTVVANWSTGV
jgi:hypothetical protein